MSIRLPQEALNQYKQLQQSTINTAPKQSGGSTEKIVTDSEPDSWINRNDLSTSSEIRATEGIRNGFYDLMDRAQPQFKITQVVNETNTPATPNYIKQSGQEQTWNDLMRYIKNAADHSAEHNGIPTHMKQSIESSMGTLFSNVRGANSQQLGTDVQRAMQPLFVNNRYGQQRINDLIDDLCSERSHVGREYLGGRTAKAMNERYAAYQAEQQAARLADAQKARQNPASTTRLEMPETPEDKERVAIETPIPTFYDQPKNMDQLAHNIALYCRTNDPPEKETIVKMLQDFLGPVPETNKHTLYCNTVNTITRSALHDLFHPEYAGFHPEISSRDMPVEHKSSIMEVFRESLTEITQNINQRLNTLQLDNIFKSFDRYIY